MGVTATWEVARRAVMLGPQLAEQASDAHKKLQYDHITWVRSGAVLDAHCSTVPQAVSNSLNACCFLSCRIGTYALVGMLLVLHMKLHALAAFELTSVGAVLVAAHCASRWTSVPLLYFCTYIQVCLHPGTHSRYQPLSQHDSGCRQLAVKADMTGCPGSSQAQLMSRGSESSHLDACAVAAATHMRSSHGRHALVTKQPSIADARRPCGRPLPLIHAQPAAGVC